MKRLGSLLVVLCIASPAFAAPKKGKGAKKVPPPPADPAPVPEPAPPPPAPIDTEPKPWAAGVSQADQDKASALYEEGNTLFAQQAHAPALAKYKEALALWDHPLIRFNLAVTEIRLERILEAADDLERSLRFGDKPFKPELYQQALDYQSLVKGRVGFIEASCDQAGAHLLLDGKPWFDCPGTKKVRVLAGEHAVTGEKPTFLTTSTKIVLGGDKTEKANVKLMPIDSAVVLRYPHRRWIPWTMTVTGLAVALGGAGTWVLGKNDFDKYQTNYSTQCQNGCEPGLTDPSHAGLASERDAAELKGKIGVSMMAVGGGVAVAGIVFAIMNRPERVLPNVEVAPRAGGAVTTVGWQF